MQSRCAAAYSAAQKAHVIKTRGRAGEAVHVGRKRCGFDTILLLWYRTYTPLVLIYKKKELKNKQQKRCLWLLLPTFEQTFKELPGNRNWHCASQVGTKFLVPNTQGEHACDSAGKFWRSPFPYKGVFPQCLCCGNPVQFHGTGARPSAWHDTLPSAVCV